MFIASMSDIHIDHPGNRPVFEAMLQRLKDERPDVVVLAGDLASSLKLVAWALKEVRQVAEKVVYVPGNHDLWLPVANAEEAGHNSWFYYHEVLREVCAQLDVHYLPQAPYISGEVALVGTTGWYDFSLASPAARAFYRDEDFLRGENGIVAWMDVFRTCFRREDKSAMHPWEVAEVMADALKTQLAELPLHVRRVCVVNHHLGFAETVVARNVPQWDFFTAFMGTRRLGEIIQADDRIRISIYGHTHTPGDRQIGHVRVIGTPLGYPRERRDTAPELTAIQRMALLTL